MSEYILEMRKVSKSFPGVQALQAVDLKIKKGEIHCLMGENGAGKSTLIKILAGAYPMDDGEIILDGAPIQIARPEDALKHGISFVFQELNVVGTLNVEQNITLGSERVKNRFVINKKKNEQEVTALLKRLNLDIGITHKVRELSASKKQLMMIAKAMARQAKLIVMDEPTAALTDREAETLFTVIRDLKKQGVSFLFVSHRLADIFTIGEGITIFRDGRNVAESEVSAVDENWVISHMVGRTLDKVFPEYDRAIGEELLTVERLSARDLIRDVSFSLCAGEVLGVSGLSGAGKSELAQALFGTNPIYGGTVRVRGKAVKLKGARSAMRQKFAYLPEERRSHGIVGVLSVRANISLAASSKIAKFGVIDARKDRKMAEDSIAAFHIKTPSMEQKIKFLSGGNQQKVIVAKWMNTDADIMLLDEPTLGIDVGAKREIYDLINDISREGKGVMMFSSELPELLGMCDRILVLREGRLTGIVVRSEATQESIMKLSIGG